MMMPEKLQPGPLASQIATFAPVSLFFFIVVLFSYAFFFKGLNGLVITIGAVVTLFVLMQVTAQVNWNTAFGERRNGLVSAPAHQKNIIKLNTYEITSHKYWLRLEDFCCTLAAQNQSSRRNTCIAPPAGPHRYWC